MIIFVTVLCLLASSCTARPNGDAELQNVITVPPNCPAGQQWVNGQCRDVWRAVTPAPANVITVPTNCPDGQAWVNGQCRDVWRAENVAPANVVTVPQNCPAGQAWVNGQCRDIWRAITPAPANVITVPPNCPPGQAWVNGQCRDIWKKIANEQNSLRSPYLDIILRGIRNAVLREKRQLDNPEIDFAVDNKNIISVPNQCPIGFRPDALGVCRPILFFTNGSHKIQL